MEKAVIEMKPVVSSNIKAVGYDAENQVARVEFINGSIYEYPGVEQGLFDNLAGAESVGKFFNANFRGLGSTKVADRTPPEEKAE